MRITAIIAIVIITVFCVSAAAYAAFISEITEMTFTSAVIDSEVPVVVWFYQSDLVGPKDPLVDPIDKVARKVYPRIKILKMDSKYNIISGQKYKINRNNTFIVFVEGQEKGRSCEIHNEKDLYELITRYVEAPPEPDKSK